MSSSRHAFTSSKVLLLCFLGMIFGRLGFCCFTLHLEVFFHLLYALLCGQSVCRVLVISSYNAFFYLNSYKVKVFLLAVIVIQQSVIFLLSYTCRKNTRAKLILSIIDRHLDHFCCFYRCPANNIDNVLVFVKYLDNLVVVCTARSCVKFSDVFSCLLLHLV